MKNIFVQTSSCNALKVLLVKLPDYRSPQTEDFFLRSESNSEHYKDYFASSYGSVRVGRFGKGTGYFSCFVFGNEQH